MLLKNFVKATQLLVWTVLALSFKVHAYESDYEQALKSFHELKFEESIIHLKNSLQQNSNHIPSRILLTKVLLEQGKGEMAEVELYDLQDAGVDVNQLVTLFAEAYILQDKYEQALEVANEGFRGKAIEAQVLYLRGQAYIGLNQMKLADAAFIDALNLVPSLQEPKLGRAQVAVSQNNLPLAMSFVDDALASYQELPNAWIMKSVIAQMQGDIDAALKAVNSAVSVRPEHLQARLSRASIYIALDNFVEAEKDLDYIIEQIPTEPRANYLKAVVTAAMGKGEDSRKNLNNVVVTLSAVPPEVMANNPSYFYLAGITNYQFGNLVEAKGYLQSYLEINEKDVETLRLLATIELRQGDASSAKSILSKANVYFPDNPSILTLLGVTMMEMGNNQLAHTYFEQVATMMPNAEFATQNLARSKIKAKDFQGAIELLNSLGTKETNVAVDTKLLLLEAHTKSKQYEQALAISKALTEQFPASSFFAQQYGRVLGLSGDVATAKQMLNKAIELSNNNISAHVNLARIDLVEGNVDVAISRLQENLTQWPENIELMLELADVYNRTGNAEQALLLNEKAYAQNTKNQAAVTKLVAGHLATGNNEKALEILLDFTRREPQAYEVRIILARLYMGMNQPRKAIESLNSTVSSMSDRVPAYILLSQAYLSIEDRSSAVKSLNKAIAWDEDSVEPLIALFPITLSLNDYKRADQVIYGLEKLIPNQAIIDMFSARLAQQQGEAKLAERHFKEAFKKQPGNKALLGIVHSLNAQQKYQQGRTVINNWLKQNPNDILVEIALAESYQLAGENEQLAQHYAQLIEKYNRLPILLNNAAVVLFDTDKKEQAREFAAEAYQKAPRNVSIIDTLAWIESRMGNHAKALNLFRDALVIDFNNPSVKYHLAQTLEKEGRRKEAKKLLIEIVNSDRAFDEKAEVEQLLKSWLGR